MKVTPFLQRALDVLAGAGHHGIDATTFGATIWYHAKRSGRVSSVNGGGDYAAQCLLGRLRKAGLVEHAPSEGSSLWRLSRAGRRAQKGDL